MPSTRKSVQLPVPGVLWNRILMAASSSMIKLGCTASSFVRLQIQWRIQFKTEIWSFERSNRNHLPVGFVFAAMQEFCQPVVWKSCFCVRYRFYVFSARCALRGKGWRRKKRGEHRELWKWLAPDQALGTVSFNSIFSHCFHLGLCGFWKVVKNAAKQMEWAMEGNKGGEKELKVQFPNYNIGFCQFSWDKLEILVFFSMYAWNSVDLRFENRMFRLCQFYQTSNGKDV